MSTQKLRIWTFAVCLACGFQFSLAQTQTVTLRTQLAVGEQLTLAVGAERGVTVDWGDGQAIAATSDTITGTLKSQIITIQGPLSWSTLSCEGQQVDSLNVQKATNLKSLFCANNLLSTLSLSTLTSLTDLDCSHNKLTSLSLSANKELIWVDCSYNEITAMNIYSLAAIQEFNCSNNKLTAISFYKKNSELTSINCTNNKLTSLSLANLTALKSIFCFNNELENITLNVNDSTIEELWCDYNKLTTLNIAKCTNLKQLSCTNNNLSSITYPNADTKKDYTLISCQNNNLTFKNFIKRQNVEDYAVNYTYSPQALVEVQETVEPGTEFDLSEYRYNAADTYIGTTYVAYAEDGTALTKTTDYKTSSGKITFTKAIDGNVYIVMKASAYPSLSLQTTNFKVVDTPTDIQSVKVDKQSDVTVSTDGNTLSISAPASRMVKVYASDGSLVWSGTVSGTKQIQLPKGIYLVNGKKIIL